MPPMIISPRIVKARFEASEELALLDVREHGEYGEAHPFHAVNLPYSRFELLLEQLVPRRDVTLVLFDQQNEGRALACAHAAERLGYTQVSVLSDGANGWEAAGYTLFAGVNVPSKTFGELVHELFATPSISAATLAEWQNTGQPVTVLDGRTLAEYRKMSIPGSYACPNGELALRAVYMIPDTERPVVVNCAGRTRSIIGAQTLRWLGISNPVYALENGTQGWRLAGLPLEQNQTRLYPKAVESASEQARQARHVAIEQGAIELSAQDVGIWLADDEITTYLFDVRTAEEYALGHFPGAVHAPGGQLLQATDHWIGVTGARVILVDDDGCRAPMVAAWLSLMGIRSAWVSDDREEWQKHNRARASYRVWSLLPDLMELTLDADIVSGCTLLDCRSSTDFRQSHLAQAYWINRSLITRQLAEIAPRQPIVLVATDAGSARLIASDLETEGYQVRGWWEWDRATAESAGLAVVQTPKTPADVDCVDFLFFVHDRHDGNLDAARRYLAWETGLLAQLDIEELRTFRLPSTPTDPIGKTV